MAKSLRSKWRRKMNAIKRERYGKKELEKLKMIVNNAKLMEAKDVEMSDLVTVVPASEIKKNSVEETIEETIDQPMETNRGVSYDKNKFPIWLGSSKRKKLIKRNRKVNKLKKKELKKSIKKRN